MTQNNVLLVGYVGEDPIVFVTKNGEKLAVMKVATHHCVKTGDEKKWITTWHKVVSWEESAAYAERSFLKGSHIMVTGSIAYWSHIDKNGMSHLDAEIRAESLTNLDR
jgi:single-strand DNA-binding protein